MINIVNCVFCQRIQNGKFKYSNDYAVAFNPLNPVTEGHMLIVPRIHIKDFTEDFYAAGKVMEFAGELYERSNDINLITSKGPNATQTVYHMHIHIIPRWENDGLRLPWS